MRFILCLFCLINATFNYAASHKPEDFLQSIAGKSHEGEAIVQHYCLTCHAKKPMIPLNAPPIGEKTAWDKRMKQGMQVLFEHADIGYNAMPARGGCFECSDEQLMLAILALLPKK